MVLIDLTIIKSVIPFFHVILSDHITFESSPQQGLLSLRTGQSLPYRFNTEGWEHAQDTFPGFNAIKGIGK